MRKYMKTFYKTFFITSLLTIVLNLIIIRRFSIALAYVKISVSVLLISIFVALAIRVFKSEKGRGYINAILGFLLIIPALLIIRSTYGTYLFRFTYTIYIIIAVIGLIYGVALLVASKKYKTEVNELNRLLLEKDEDNEEEDE
ncbi:MAG: hypothetical protein JEZ05_01120 [Tenericutes bacterium]|nr:hypothetical protein [Mycoplasmatota bacterium]